MPVEQIIEVPVEQIVEVPIEVVIEVPVIKEIFEEIPVYVDKNVKQLRKSQY